MANTQGAPFGVHSEVGQLRKVMVCAPGHAHQRLTPSNCDALLYDDVIWVDVAKRDHFDFTQKLRDRGVEVVEMHNLLTGTVAIPEAKKWILDNQVVPNQVGLGLVDEIRSYLEGLPDRELAETLIGGLSTYDFPETHGGEMLKLVRDGAGVTEYLLPPLPNTLYTRDTTCWIYGVTLNPLYWPARHEETILAIYKFHPDFAGKVNVWWGDPTEDHGLAALEGGDVMPIAKGNVLIGMGERTSRQAISQLAAALFAKGAAERVIVAAMPRLRAAMHLDTVFTFVDRDCVLIYPDIVNTIEAFSYRPADAGHGFDLRKDEKPFVDVVAEALGLKKLRVVQTGGKRRVAADAVFRADRCFCATLSERCRRRHGGADDAALLYGDLHYLDRTVSGLGIARPSLRARMISAADAYDRCFEARSWQCLERPGTRHGRAFSARK
jgi:arginine deiminase